jgi:hypothetical protein
MAGTLLAFTVEEACEVLDPAMQPGQLRAIIAALGIPPAGSRYTGRAGRPVATWDAAELMRLHAALMPWLVTPGELPA